MSKIIGTGEAIVVLGSGTAGVAGISAPGPANCFTNGILDTFARVPALTGSSGCTTTGNYPWADAFNSGTLTVDGNWHLTINPAINVSQALWAADVELPLDPFSLTVDLLVEAHPATWPQPANIGANTANFELDIDRNDDAGTNNFRVILDVSKNGVGGISVGNTFLDLYYPGGHVSTGAFGNGALAETPTALNLVITPTTYALSFATLSLSGSWTPFASTTPSGDVTCELNVQGRLINDGYFETPSSPSSDFDIILDTLTVSSDRGNCASVPSC